MAKPYLYQTPGEFQYGDSGYYYIVYTYVDVAGNGIPSGEANGTHGVSVGSVTVQATGIASGEAFGDQSTALNPDPPSIASEEAFGTPSLHPQPVIVGAQSFDDDTVYGSTDVLAGFVPIAVQYTASQELVESPFIQPWGPTLTPNAIASGEMYGQAVLDTGTVNITPPSLQPSEDVVSPLVQPQPVNIAPQSFVDGNMYGDVSVLIQPAYIFIPALQDGADFGAQQILPQPVSLTVEQIGSEEGHGSPALHMRLFMESIPSGESIGGIQDIRQVVYVPVSGIGSEELFGTLTTLYAVFPEGIRSQERFGSLRTLVFVILSQQINSGETFGDPSVARTFIPREVREFDYDFFQALYEKEQYCYDNDWDGASETYDETGTLVTSRYVYEPLFEDLRAAIQAWFNVDRTELMREFIDGLYSYIVFDRMYGTGDSLIAQSNAAEIFDMDGFVHRIKTEPVDYYFDYTETRDVNGNRTSYSAPNITSDIALIQAAHEDQEIPELNSLSEQYRAVFGAKIHDLLFNDYPPQEVVTKEIMAEEIFVNLNYMDVYQTLNVNLNIPPYLL